MDHVLYINLNHRTDRKEHVEHQLKILGITGTRIPATLHKNGALGCIMSHIRCIEHAKQNQWKSVYVMEDDITFTNPDAFKTSLSYFLNESIHWDVLLLGSNMAPPFQQIHEYYARVFNAQTTTGYIVKEHYYDTLLKNFNESLALLTKFSNKSLYAIDMYWKRLQHKDQWYILTPLTIVQLPGFSDIENNYTDYTRSMLSTKNINKNI
jgi:glycosyl transferase family 25